MTSLGIESLAPLLLIPVIGALTLYTALWMRLMSGYRRASAILLRLALITLIASALAGASVIRTSERLAVVMLVDVSDSVARFGKFGTRQDGTRRGVMDAAIDWLERARVSAKPEDLIGVVAFDGQAMAVVPPTNGPLGRIETPPGREGTNIAAAIRTATSMVPPSTRLRLVLVSDGNQTAPGSGSGGRVELGGSVATQQQRAPIDILPVRYRVDQEVVFESLEAPDRVGIGAQQDESQSAQSAALDTLIEVRAILRSVSASPARGQLRLSINDQPVPIGPEGRTGRDVQLSAGVNVERLTVPLGRGRVHRLEATFEPETDADGYVLGDTVLENNRARAITLAAGPVSVLLVDGSAGGSESAALLTVLQRAGLDAEVWPPERLAADPLWMQTRDVVVLVNVPADAMDRDVHGLLASYVNDAAGGLVMVGGEESLGPGGWKGTAVEPILPVRLDLPERLISPAAAVVLVLDVSGSMRRGVMGTGLSQMRIAAEGAAEAIKTLDKSDLVGVITFSDQTSEVIALGPNTNAEATAAQVRRISADSGTIMGPALELARTRLQAAKADEKHVIVLSDGRSQDAERIGLIADGFAEAGIRVTSISVGDGADSDTLRQLSSRSGGRFYRVIDPTLLPRVMVKAVRVVRTPMIKNGPIPVSVLPGGSIAAAIIQTGVSPQDLGGMVITRVRDEPTVTHEMMTSEGEPLLAHWNVGVGRVGVFASDVKTWAEPWLDWPGFERLWPALIETISRKRPDRGMDLRTWFDDTAGDGRLWVRVEATDDSGRAVTGLEIPARVFETSTGGTGGGIGTASGLLQTQLEEVDAGLYQGWVRAERSGIYVVIASPTINDSTNQTSRRFSPLVSGIVRSAGAEYRTLTNSDATLDRLRLGSGDAARAASGPDDGISGRELLWDSPETSGVFDRTGLQARVARQPIWQWLLWAALCVLMLDIATRRIAWDRYLDPNMEGTMIARVRERVRDRSADAASALQRLRGHEPTSEQGKRASSVTTSPSRSPTIRRTPEPETYAKTDQSLGDDAAIELVRNAEARRQASRRTGTLNPSASSPAGSSAPFTAPSKAGDTSESGTRLPDDPPASASGLFAAKQRAKRRIDEQVQPGGNDERSE